jgi:hypothetical protein
MSRQFSLGSLGLDQRPPTPVGGQSRLTHRDEQPAEWQSPFAVTRKVFGCDLQNFSKGRLIPLSGCGCDETERFERFSGRSIIAQTVPSNRFVEKDMIRQMMCGATAAAMVIAAQGLAIAEASDL